MRKLAVTAAAVVAGTAAPTGAFAQCAMCSTAVGSSAAVARGFAISILFLLSIVFLVTSALVVLVVRRTRPAVGREPLPSRPRPHPPGLRWRLLLRRSAPSSSSS